jgi:hypothetical protein
MLLHDINESVKSLKPYVKFGMSPFGIWKNGVPPGIIGMNAYSQIYCDAIAWLQQGSIDYLTPQLYWKIGGSQDYVKLVNWWADSVYANHRHFYPGQIVGTDRSYTAAEIPNQIKEDRKLPTKVQGNVLFRARLVTANALGVEDSLKNNYFKNLALAPVMDWMEMTPPNTPQNVRFEKAAGKGVSQLVWDAPSAAIDGDTAAKYVIYNFSVSAPQETDVANSSNIADIIGLKYYIPEGAAEGKTYFAVTSLDRNSNESVISNVVELAAPVSPVLALPANNAENQKDTVTLKWNYALNAGGYNLQVSTSPDFSSDLLYNVSNIYDTVYVIKGMYGQTKYYWKVQSVNAVGTSEFSEVNAFTTGFPVAPEPTSPSYGSLEVSLTPELAWTKNAVAEHYGFQLGTSKPLITSTTVIDTVVSDTLFSVTHELLGSKVYYWRVLASNAYGSSAWSDYSAFKTKASIGVEEIEDEIPSDYDLLQNYPNPFNPSTIITFKIKEA